MEIKTEPFSMENEYKSPENLLSTHENLPMPQEIYIKNEVTIKTEIEDVCSNFGVNPETFNKQDVHYFECKFCIYKVSKIDDFLSHTQKHNIEKRRLELFLNNDTEPLKSRNTNSPNIRFKCMLCDYQCDNNDDLLVHIGTHTREKPYKCEICDYRCTGRSYLRQHITTHTREKPFKCGLCNYRSSKKSNVKTHMNIHTGVKIFKCELCSYKCSVKNSLRRHVAIHNFRNALQCELCEFKAFRKCHLRSHMISHKS